MDRWDWDLEPLADGGMIGENFGPDELLGERLQPEGVEHGLDESVAVAEELFEDGVWGDDAYEGDDDEW